MRAASALKRAAEVAHEADRAERACAIRGLASGLAGAPDGLGALVGGCSVGRRAREALGRYGPPEWIVGS